MEVTTNSNPETTKSGLRPNLSLNVPANTAPTSAPIKALLMAQPICSAPAR